jgi:hypothetical protein
MSVKKHYPELRDNSVSGVEDPPFFASLHWHPCGFWGREHFLSVDMPTGIFREKEKRFKG